MLRRTGGCVAACLAVVLLTTGCSADPRTAKPKPTKSSASPKPPSPSVDPAVQAARVKAAVISAAKARQLGLGSPNEEKAGEWIPDGGCVEGVEGDGNITHSYRRYWEVGSRIASHTTHAFRAWSPARSLPTMQSIRQKCGSYEVDGNTFEYAGDVSLGSLTGVEGSYALCERAKGDGLTWYICTAYLVRGDLLSELSAADLAASRPGPSQRLLLRLVPPAAEALAAA